VRAAHDHRAIVAAVAATHRAEMDAAHLLSALGLVIGTADYSLMVRRRAKVRRQLRETEASQQIGLRGLVRVLLVDR
jgi:hypothetical protein